MESRTDRHPIDAWLGRVGKNQTWLAQETGVSTGAVSRWISLASGISPAAARQIEVVSGGDLEAAGLLAWQSWAIELAAAGKAPHRSDWSRSAKRLAALP